jgi:peptidoglycan/xylan/chitin deacetylase (PgdA/CDA1 family)
MTLEEVREVRSRGIGLAPHTHSHRRLTTLSLKDALEDVHHGSEWFGHHELETEPFFAYPFGQPGDVSAELTQGIRALGYEPLTTIPTLVTKQTKRKFAGLGLPRLSVGPLEVPTMNLLARIFPVASTFPGLWLGALAVRRKLLTGARQTPSQ